MSNLYLLAAGLTLDDVRITSAMFLPILDSVKTVFMQTWPYLLGILALRIAAWLVPVLLRKIGSPKKS